jgi:hypothetical protein
VFQQKEQGLFATRRMIKDHLKEPRFVTAHLREKVENPWRKIRQRRRSRQIFDRMLPQCAHAGSTYFAISCTIKKKEGRNQIPPAQRRLPPGGSQTLCIRGVFGNDPGNNSRDSDISTLLRWRSHYSSILHATVANA